MHTFHNATISADQLNAISPEQFAEHLAGPPEQAALWIRAAAEQGLADAQALLGQLLLDGHGLPADPAAARLWFARAAAQQHAMAINMLGRCHELGWGGAVDTAQAAALYQQAAGLGLDWAMYNYANLLLRGDGVPRDETEALGWYRKAAALGNAKSLGVLGRFYEEGWVVPADRATAVDYYRQAAIGGDFRGQYNYALLLAEQGEMQQAIDWLHQALQGAHLRFARTMAATLASYPVVEFQRIALLAHEKCCQLGDAEDYFAYAQALLDDRTQAASPLLARTWLIRAASKGHRAAEALLAAMDTSRP